MSARRRPKTGYMTRIVLLISLMILLGRLLYAIPGAINHHQEKKVSVEGDVANATQPVNR